MKLRLALVGAGGKMGLRCSKNLLKSQNYQVKYLEIEPTAIAHLAAMGIQPVAEEEALADAEIMVLAIPDHAIKSVSAALIPKLPVGALVVALDPAAPLAGNVFFRPDLAYYVTHPAHPSVFNWEPTEAAYRDYYGGHSAKQSVVSALMHGKEVDYLRGDELTKVLFQPVTVNHRITVEQMAILEPGFSETLCSTCIKKVRDALEVVVAKGVPREAARDFILGHLNIQLAVLFDELPIQFSDAALKALERAESILFKEDWEKIFDMDNIHEQIKAITQA